VPEQLVLDESNLADYLRGRGLVRAGEAVQAEKAGDGNINWVRRVRRSGPGGTFVVKQARPALERFPQYSVTTERILFEARYYESVAPLDPEALCPRVLDFDPDARVLVLEDLGDVPRLDRVLESGDDTGGALEVLVRFLARVHQGTRDRAELLDRFHNPEMQRLHGDHIFELPLRPNDFPLAPPVAERAAALRNDRELVAIADGLYARYLGTRRALVHGDVQGANVLLTPDGPRLLDAEIAHVGDPAFDVGILLAHVLLPAPGPPARARAAALWSIYRDASDEAALPDPEDVSRYAGVEVLRRIIGAARVPSAEEPRRALAALDLATELLRTGALVDGPGA